MSLIFAYAAILVAASPLSSAFIVQPTTRSYQGKTLSSELSIIPPIRRRSNSQLNVVENSGALQQGELFPLAQEIFPGAVTYNELLNYIVNTLTETGFDLPKTLLGTSLCCDELNRPLEQLLAKIFENYYNLGGMAGCAFGGVTSFRKMKSHVPDGGNAVIVFGTHVGIGSQGQVGSVEREKVADGDLCCRSAILASEYVSYVYNGGTPDPSPTDLSDISQHFVQNMLMPQAERLENSQNRMVELPYALYDGQIELIRQIIKEGSEAGFPGVVAAFGGIQLNTPPGYQDYFVPLNGDLYGEDGELIMKFF